MELEFIIYWLLIGWISAFLTETILLCERKVTIETFFVVSIVALGGPYTLLIYLIGITIELIFGFYDLLATFAGRFLRNSDFVWDLDAPRKSKKELKELIAELEDAIFSRDNIISELQNQVRNQLETIDCMHKEKEYVRRLKKAKK